MPRPARPRRRGFTLTDVARHLNLSTTAVRRLARFVGVRLRPVRPVRNNRRDFRPRKTARRDFRLLSRAAVKAILAEYYLRVGERFAVSLEPDKKGGW